MSALTMAPAAPATRLRFSAHAIARYGERMRYGTDPTHVARELENMRSAMTLTTVVPTWLAARLRHDADAFLVLGDAVFLLRAGEAEARSWTAVTCLVRGLRDRRKHGTSAVELGLEHAGHHARSGGRRARPQPSRSRSIRPG